MSTPRYLVATGAEATSVLRRLARAGWRTREGFAPADGEHLVCYGRVVDAEAARLAVRAAAGGAGVVVITDPGGEVGRVLREELARLGPLGDQPDLDTAAADGDTAPVLAPEQRALLERLANGETIASAAAAEYLSLRTANRRIAQARDVLGVRTTREAVLAYLRQRRPL